MEQAAQFSQRSYLKCRLHQIARPLHGYFYSGFSSYASLPKSLNGNLFRRDDEDDLVDEKIGRFGRFLLEQKKRKD